MKTILPLLIAASTLQAQEDFSVVELGRDFIVKEAVLPSSHDPQSFVTNRVVELASGLNYWNGQEWKPSNPIFKLQNGQAIADEVSLKITLAQNINAEGSVTMTTPDGTRFRSTPLLLVFRDTANNETVVVGEIKDALAQQLDASTIIYPDAMEGVAATLRYSLRGTAKFEQELLIQEPIRSQDFGLPDAPTVQLELWTGFYEVGGPVDAKPTQNEGLDDVFLDFGSVQIGGGKTFAIDAQAPEGPVVKRFGQVEGDPRFFLVEIIHQEHLKPLVDALDQAGVKQPDVKRLARKVHKSDKSLVAEHAQLKLSKKNLTASLSRRPIGPAISIDYTAISGSLGSYTFACDTTYYVSGNTTFGGAGAVVTMEGGTVIKMLADTKMTFNCPVVCQGQPYRPIVVTARDDHSIGQRIGTNLLSGQYATCALEFDGTVSLSDALLQNLSIRHAKVGIRLKSRTGHRIDHAQFVNCGYGVILESSASTLLRNGLFANTTTNLSGSGCTVRAEHITSDTASHFMSNLGNLYLTNSLLVAVTTPGTPTSSQNVQTVASAAGVFASAVSGHRYLAGNTYRNQGMTNISFFTEIRKTTTYPPVLLSGHFTIDTTLFPLAQRDTDAFDLGYHYWPLDVCLSNRNLSATLLMTNGVAVGVYGDSGLNLQSGAKLVSQGRPEALNRIVRYHAVQEGTTVHGTNTGTYLGLMEMTSTPATRPEVRLRFSELSLMADGNNDRRNILFLGSSAAYAPNVVDIQDCVINGKLSFLPDATSLSYTLKNNIFTRPDLSTTDGQYGGYGLNLTWRNNLFLKGTISLNHSTYDTTWVVHDNVFDTVSFYVYGTQSIQNTHNGYKSTTVMPGAMNSQTLTTLDWQTGPLGNYYYNTSSSATNTAYLLNAGSQANAGNVGLHWYTTRVDQTKEGTGVLDIGFHSIATTGSTSTTPLDDDGDGNFSYLEDVDGDGVVDAGELAFNVYNSSYGIGSGPGLVVFTPLK